MCHLAQRFNVCPPYQSVYVTGIDRSRNFFNDVGNAGNEADAILKVGKSFLITRE